MERKYGVAKIKWRPQPDSIDSVEKAESYRDSVVREIERKLVSINDSAIPESDVRALNDALQTLHGEQRAWEIQIKLLGGNDYLKYAAAPVKFFGRAKDLPEARSRHPLEYYGVYKRTLIDASTDLVKAEMNRALGKRRFETNIHLPASDPLPTSAQVERWMLQKKKEALLALLRA